VLTGVKEGIPIFVGYFPVAIAFGLLAKSAALSFGEAGLFSALVFAGAAQFIAVTLYASGVGFGSIIVTTFLINSRHLLLSAAVAARLHGTRRFFPLAAFGVTDETFAIATTRPETYGTPYLMGLNTTAWLGWLSGTLAGFLAGGFMPSKLQAAMGILLYVMFLGILMPEVRKDLRVLAVAGLSGVIHWALRATGWLPDGWALVGAIIVSVALVDGLKGRMKKQ
jgi:4-azaleucine resistance transporter AzlC